MARLENEVLSEDYERMPPNEVGVIFIGPSGVGKSTLRDYICDHGDSENNYTKYSPLTTRQKRPGEDGEYRFVTPDEMAAAKAGQNVIFGNQSYGNEFLTLWPERLPEDTHYLYIYLPEAAAKLKEAFPATRIVQIRPASLVELKDRITARDPNITDQELLQRIDAVEEELSKGAEIADAIIVNDASVDEVGTHLQNVLRELTNPAH
jgi:guanylate kinase